MKQTEEKEVRRKKKREGEGGKVRKEKVFKTTNHKVVSLLVRAAAHSSEREGEKEREREKGRKKERKKREKEKKERKERKERKRKKGSDK